MHWNNEDISALHALESTIIRLASRHSEMNDYNVDRAYEAGFQLYRARLRGHEPKPAVLGGLDLDTFTAVRETCEQLLATGAPWIEGTSPGNTNPVAVEKLVDYLRELARSVKRHTLHGGRSGYLEFLRDYVR